MQCGLFDQGRRKGYNQSIRVYMTSKRSGSVKLVLAAAAAVFLIAAAAGCYFFCREYPELLRARTEVEKLHPVCVLGVSEPTGIISGDKAGLRNIFINWKTSFPQAAVKAIRAAGAIPVITWEPYFDDIRRDALLPAIAAGKYDAYIDRFAAQAGGGPLFIRFAHEPNSDWYGWSGTVSSPEVYVKAFRRVRTVFARSDGAVKFIFSVNSEDVPAAAWNRFENYYPGDGYADVIGLDAYNWGAGNEAWQHWKAPGKILAAPYERAVKAFPSKPIFLTETASSPLGGDKAFWVSQLLGAAARFPAVKAIVWFDFKKDIDWTLSPAMRSRFYGACGQGRFECAGPALAWIFKENQ